MAEQKNFSSKLSTYTPSDLSKRWFVYYYDPYGKRVKRYGDINRFGTLRERRRALKQLVEEIKSGMDEEIKSTIKDHNQKKEKRRSIKERLYERVDRKKNIQRKKTIQTYTSKLNSLFNFVQTNNPSQEQLEQFFEYLLLNRHAATYTRYVIDLRSFFREIGLEHYFTNIKTESYRHTPKRYYQEHQIKLLKNYILPRDPDLWLCVQFLFYCFIRPNESRCMQAGHILFDESKIVIPGSQSKNGRTQYVAIPDAFIGQLEYIKKMPPDQYIFKSSHKGKNNIGVNTMSTRHRKVLSKLGFQKGIYSLYSWKHTGAVMAVKNGIDLKDLQIQLRHHSLDQVDQYLRQLGVHDLTSFRQKMPAL